MNKFFEILKSIMVHRSITLDKENLDVYQFPLMKEGEQIDFVYMPQSTNHPQHVHEKSSARIYVITGKGKIYLNDIIKNYNQGEIINIPKGTYHGFDVEEETLLLSIQDHPILSNDKLDFRYK